jgi:uncharacterized protein
MISHSEKTKGMNKKNMWGTILLLVVFLFSCNGLSAQENLPAPQNPPKLVNDFADILSPQQEQALERKLVAFSDTTSNQITIVIVSDFNGYDKANFAYGIGNKWKVGQKEFDNGVVIALRPKTSREKGEVFIATGYGLEPAIPDATANRIVDVEMIPHFENNDYFEGLNQATDVLMSLAVGEYNSDQYRKETSSGGAGFLVPIIVMIIIIVMIKRGNSSHRNYGGRSGGSSGLLGALLLMSMGNRHTGSWNDFSSGSGSFGGGGGFGGFGGGSFGGGGAGGSW